jgi:hypothetical protein
MTALVLDKEIQLWDKEAAAHRAKKDADAMPYIRANRLSAFPPVQPTIWSGSMEGNF